MAGEKNLETLLMNIEPMLDQETYVFVTLKTDVPSQGLRPRMVFQEPEGTTLIVPLDQALDSNLPYEFPCKMITLKVHSSLEAVGFIARIATALASKDMGVNPVSGFYHDHLFVPLGREKDAMNTINAICEQAHI